MSDDDVEIVSEDPESTEPEPEAPDTVTAGIVPQSRSYATPELAEQAGQFNALWSLASQIAGTEFVPAGLRNNPPKVFAAMATGHGLRIDPMSAMRHISVIDGKPNLSAELQLTLVRRAGHTVVGEVFADKATVTGRRADTGEEMTVTYSLKDAEQAGLVKIGDDGRPIARSKSGAPLPWERYTQSMLWARAVTTLVTRLFPECTIGEAQ